MKSNRQTERLLGRMVAEVPARLIELGYARDTCILHTRVAVDILRELGVTARPLAARVMVFNAKFAEETRRLGHFPLQGDDLSPEAWNVVIGYGTDPSADRPGFDGHLLAVVNERWALDLTIDQASRPKYGIELAPHFWAVDQRFLRGEAPDIFEAGGSYVRYEADPDERGFLHAGDWKNISVIDSHRINPTRALVRDLRAA